jgi:hypothetical protein
MNNIIGNINEIDTKHNQKDIKNTNTKKQPIPILAGFSVVSHLGLSESLELLFTEKNQDI